MCVFMYVWGGVGGCVCVYVRAHARAYVCVCTRVRAYVLVCMRAYVRVRACVRACVHFPQIPSYPTTVACALSIVNQHCF